VAGYLRCKLSLRDLVEMIPKVTSCGAWPSGVLSLAHTTILRWVRRFARSSSNAGTALLCPQVNHGGLTKRTEDSWQIAYLYRAVDRAGQTINRKCRAEPFHRICDSDVDQSFSIVNRLWGNPASIIKPADPHGTKWMDAIRDKQRMNRATSEAMAPVTGIIVYLAGIHGPRLC
jgi:hypothetical protein